VVHAGLEPWTRRVQPIKSQQVLVKPVNGLQEGLFLGVFGHFVGDITPNCEPMLNPRIQVDLVRVAGLFEDNLRLVSLLGGEDDICLGRRDSKGACNAGQLFLFDKRGMRKIANLNAVLVVASNILPSMLV